MLIILAEAASNVDPYSGWTATGLLSMLLCWLLYKHLPDKDKQVREQQQEHISDVRVMQDKFTTRSAELQEFFQMQLKEVTDHCKEELSLVKKQDDERNAQIIGILKELKRE